MYRADQNLEIVKRKKRNRILPEEVKKLVFVVIVRFVVIIDIRNIAKKGDPCPGGHSFTPTVGPKYWLHGPWAGGPKLFGLLDVLLVPLPIPAALLSRLCPWLILRCYIMMT